MFHETKAMLGVNYSSFQSPKHMRGQCSSDRSLIQKICVPFFSQLPNVLNDDFESAHEQEEKDE